MTVSDGIGRAIVFLGGLFDSRRYIGRNRSSRNRNSRNRNSRNRNSGIMNNGNRIMNNGRMKTRRMNRGWIDHCLPQARTEAATGNNCHSGAAATAFRQLHLVLDPSL